MNNRAIQSGGELDAKLAREILDLNSIGLIVIDASWRIVFWNEWMKNASGISSEEAVDCHLIKLFPELADHRLEQTIASALDNGMPAVLSHKFHAHVLPLFVNSSSNRMSQQVIVRPINDDVGHCLIQVMDVSSSVARDKMLRDQAALYRSQEMHTRAILTSIADAVITTDIQCNIDYMNVVAETYIGWKLEEAKGKSLQEVYSVLDESTQGAVEQVQHCLREGVNLDSQGKDLVLLHRDGRGVPVEQSVAPIRGEDDQIVGAVMVFRDVSHSRQLAAQLHWQATHDTLTGLVNRGTFDDRLERLLTDSRETGKSHSLLYLDLDQFKIVNDTSGHVAGDELLRQVSQLLSTEIRSHDTLARLGGDEFGVLLANCPESVAIRIANQLRAAIREFRFSWGDKSFSIGVSIGVVAIQPDSESVDHILSAADTACYTAKDTGRDNVHLFKADAGEAALRQGEMQWVTRIQDALDANRFMLYAQSIQPILDSADAGHYEVLIRMLDENGGLVPPGAFIPAAERFNLMPKMDRWVVENVFHLVEKERDRLVGGGVCFAINLSGGSVSDEETLQFILDKVKQFEIPVGMISFEITETAAISNLSSANHFIRALKKVGCKFSLDDFGSGLSSFAYLKNLPVDYLKIDGAFVRDVATDPIDRAMVESINQIGHVMELQTIAEFVENDQILEILQGIGVDYAQGYGVAKPTPLADGSGNLLLDQEA